MSNLGLQRSLEDRGIEFLRAPVGDRNVLSMLKQRGGLLGGETSGHVIDLSRTTTGDGLVIALQVLHILAQGSRRLSELAGAMPRLPQTLLNVRVERGFDVDVSEEVRSVVDRVESELNGRGRVVLRASGTEPVVRVMVEGDHEEVVARAAETIAAAVREAATG
jgi:phosphoglucosamine mutase